jgi:Zn-dependent peptidase ImmA (M78 family)
MNRKRQNEIEAIAKKILQESHCYKAPIEVNKVVEYLNINLKEHNFGDDISGVYLNDGKQAVIGFNSKNVEKRQRFTIAHELGHYILEHERDGVFIDNPSKYLTILFRDKESSTGEYLQEREANAFAAALLMPMDLIDEVIKEYYNPSFFPDEEDLNIVEKLCERFNVSQQAMSFRLSNLNKIW